MQKHISILTFPRQILYGVPLAPSHVHRLAMLRNKIRPCSVSVLIDNPYQLQSALVFKQSTGIPLQVFVKIDLGYHRAGLDYTTKSFRDLVKNILSLERSGCVTLVGFYTHAGQSYGGNSDLGAIRLLMDEIEGLQKAAIQANKFDDADGHSHPRYILSVGATPTTTSIENFLSLPREESSSEMHKLIRKAKDLIQHVKQDFSLELHAGVYPFLDMQQLATRASPSAYDEGTINQASKISTNDVALTIVAEVASVYSDRACPEALIAAGSLALGREPCKSYNGWGIVSGWGMNSKIGDEGRSGWQVGRISQEHGILTKDSNVSGEPVKLKVGQKVRIWPNHACVAGAGFGWYLLVDSSLPEGRRDEIVDVWVRWRGW